MPRPYIPQTFVPLYYRKMLRKDAKMKGKKVEMQFGRPNFKNEWGENTDPDNKKKSSVYREFSRLGKSEWIKLVKKGKMVKLTFAQAHPMKVENTEAGMTNAFNKLDKPKRERAMKQVDSGKMELSILAKYSDGFKFLVAGNTRLTAMMEAFGEVYVWQFDVPDDGE